MSSDQLFIGIDSGTQGTKAVVFSRKLGRIIAQGYASHQIKENSRGGREQEPDWWLAACTKALNLALQHPDVDSGQVKAMAVSGQQHGLVPLDAQGNVIRPAKLWCDTETTDQCQTLTRNAGGAKAVIEAVGNSVAAGFTASKLLWLREQEPENYARLNTVLLPHDYINYWLTGQKKSEYGDASGTAYFDVRRRQWSHAMLYAIDDTGRLEQCLPDLLEPDEPSGILRPELVAEFNLPQNVLVAAGGGDNMMAAIGTGNIKPGVVTASLGTSGTIYAYSDRPVVDPRGELAAFCSSSGGWLPLVCTMNVTVATELMRRNLGLGVEELNAKANTAPIGADDLLLLPYFNGERTPALPDAKATLSGLSAVNFTPENLCRAAMEGATFGLRYALGVLNLCGITPKEIRLVGGGAKSAVWRQMAADIFHCPVVLPAADEAGALGAAIQAMWCYGKHNEGAGPTLSELCECFIKVDPNGFSHPEPDHVARYTELYENYRYLDHTMRPLNYRG